jgi:hypothetical protein
MNVIDNVTIMYCKALSLGVPTENCEKALLLLFIKERL